jgi:predicted aspartyl protease
MKRAKIIILLFVFLGLMVPAAWKAAPEEKAEGSKGLLTKIPFRLHGTTIVAELAVDDSVPLSFIFDTAAGGTVINVKTAAKLGIVGDEIVSREGATGKAQIVRSENHAVNVGNLRLRNMTLGIAEFGHIERRMGMRFDGIIGWLILSRYAVRVNYDEMQIEIYDSGMFDSGLGSTGYDIDVPGTVIFTNVTVTLQNGESFSGKVLVDTGSGGTILFNTPFAEANDLLAKIGKYYEWELQGLSADKARTCTTILESLRIGDNEFSAVPASIAFTKAGAASWPRIMGILGNDVLKRFNMSIDLKHKKMSLEPNQLYSEPFVVNCSGVELGLDDTLQKVIVVHVYESSPAHQEGLMAGDEIVRINGEIASQLGLPQVRRMLSQAGKEVEIVVDRKGETRSCLLKLRPLIEQRNR